MSSMERIDSSQALRSLMGNYGDDEADGIDNISGSDDETMSVTTDPIVKQPPKLPNPIVLDETHHPPKVERKGETNGLLDLLNFLEHYQD